MTCGVAGTAGSASDRARARVPPVSRPLRAPPLLVRVSADDRDLEIAVLHQLRIMSRRGKRPRYRTAGRVMLAAASRFLSPRAVVGLPGCPRHAETLAPPAREQGGIEGVQEAGTSSDRSGGSRPDPSDGEGERRWATYGSRGELLKLGTTVSTATIANVLRRGGLGPAPRRIEPTCSQFLRRRPWPSWPPVHSAQGPRVTGSGRAGPDASARDGTDRSSPEEGCCLSEAPSATPSGDPAQG